MQLSKAEWAEHLARWREGGETASRYCQEHGLKLGSLRYWSGRIRRESAKALNDAFEGAPRFAKVRGQDSGEQEVALARTTSTPLRLRVGGVEIEVAEGFDAQTLRRVIGVLQSPGGGS